MILDARCERNAGPGIGGDGRMVMLLTLTDHLHIYSDNEVAANSPFDVGTGQRRQKSEGTARFARKTSVYGWAVGFGGESRE